MKRLNKQTPPNSLSFVFPPQSRGIQGEKSYKKGFTLVELIIVITILAILATIAFVSFQNYVRDARDSNRVTTFSNLSNGFELFYTQVGNYPTPDNATTLTGGNTTLQLGVIGDNVGKLIRLNSIPKDPLTQENYVYSIGGNGYYYQIATQKENTQSSLFSQTYAAGENKLPMVKGNYALDPSLPSLIPLKSTVTSSGIFDPNVCFIIDGEGNNFSSTAANCTKKKDMELKKFDSSLVGYWDMETLSGTLLKDLSGNGNNGTFSGGMVYTSALTGGILGKGLQFNGISNFLEVVNTNNLDIDYNENFTVQMLCKIPPIQNDTSNAFKYVTLLEKSFAFSRYPYTITLGTQEHSLPGSIGGSKWDLLTNPTAKIKNNMSLNNYFILTFVREGSEIKMYKNSSLSDTQIDTTNSTTIQIGTPLYIGAGNYSLTKFTGNIDEVKIYNRALTDEEIAQQAKIAGF